MLSGLAPRWNRNEVGNTASCVPLAEAVSFGKTKIKKRSGRFGIPNYSKADVEASLDIVAEVFFKSNI